MRRLLAVALLCLTILIKPGASRGNADTRSTTQPINLIFDTDMGSDCDDAGALAILHQLADHGEVNILGVVFSSGRNRYGVGVCDAINTYYGRGDLPLGQYQKTDIGDPVDRYCKAIATTTETFHHNIIDSAPDLVQTYRDILRAQADGSVTILTVGHPHGLACLLDDAVTSGLIPRKVKQWVAMAGAPDKMQSDWNFGQWGVGPRVARLLNEWPTPLYISPYGDTIISGNRKLPATPKDNPVREAFRLYDNCLVKGRSSWDEIAVLYAVRPELFLVEPGALIQNVEYHTSWKPAPATQGVPRYRVLPRITNQEIADLIEELMSAPPRASKSE